MHETNPSENASSQLIPQLEPSPCSTADLVLQVFYQFCPSDGWMIDELGILFFNRMIQEKQGGPKMSGYGLQRENRRDKNSIDKTMQLH